MCVCCTFVLVLAVRRRLDLWMGPGIGYPLVHSSTVRTVECITSIKCWQMLTIAVRLFVWLCRRKECVSNQYQINVVGGESHCIFKGRARLEVSVCRCLDGIEETGLCLSFNACFYCLNRLWLPMARLIS